MIDHITLAVSTFLITLWEKTSKVHKTPEIDKTPEMDDYLTNEPFSFRIKNIFKYYLILTNIYTNIHSQLLKLKFIKDLINLCVLGSSSWFLVFLANFSLLGIRHI